MAEDIYTIIEQKFPGVALESPVQGWVYLEDYVKGIEAYEAKVTAHTTAQDDRWLGICYFQLFDDMKATEMFYRAVARGSESARINLAHAFIFTERSEQVIPELQKLTLQDLTTYDKVLYYRVKSYHNENSGDLEQALSDAEAAWRLVQAIPEVSILAPQILNQLGVLYGRLGRANRALWFFDQSLSILPDGMEKVKTTLRRSQLLNILGRYEETIALTQRLDPTRLPQALNAFRSITLGDAFWGKKDSAAAEAHFEEAIVQALNASAVYEEFLSRLSLSAIYSYQGLTSTASEHLARARVLISDRPDHLSYTFRATLVSSLAKDLSATQAQATLQALADEFGATGLLQEQGWVRLHIAELHRQLDNQKEVLAELDALQRLATTLQNYAFLAREWTLLPELQKRAVKTHPKIAGKPPEVLEVYTMGEEKLVLNGKVVTIRMTKAVEIIAYFLQNGQVGLKKMLLDMFPDEEYQKARNYFHQFKHELHERIPDLSVKYDSSERLYHLKTDMAIVWDVAELRSGRKMGALGIFLPGSGSEWALLMEHELEALKDQDEPTLTVQPLA